MAYTKTKSNGDVVLANTMPKAEYMYGCMPTAVGMLLGYYDLYGYQGTSMSNIIAGTVKVESRGTDGNAYDMDAFDTALGKAIASEGYKKRFYGTSPETELRYTYKSDTTELNTSEWDCLADYLGTGQYWRGNGDKATTVTSGSLDDVDKVTMVGTINSGSITRTIPWRNTSMQYGLELYVKSRGYSLDRKKTGSFNVDTNGGSFTFEDFKKEIDAGRPVIVSITGHAMVAYGYNPNTKEIIFDDCYDADQRMTWGGTYYYSGSSRSIESVETIVFNVSGGGGGGGGSTTTDKVKPTVSNVKASTTAPTNKSVTVIATFSDDVKLASALYRIGDKGSWTAYPSGGVTVTKNSTVYFQAVDAAGNKSAVASYKVTNIDTTAPSKPTITVSTKKTTTKPVTVTAKFSSDTAKKEYHLEGKSWTTYTAAITFSSNGTVYFRGADAAGNVSAVASYTVSNIKGSTTPAYDTSDCDDGNTNDWVVTKDKSGKTLRNPDSNLKTTTLTKAGEIYVDTKSVSKDGKHNFVGFDDDTDFAKIKLNSAAKLTFTASATGSAKFTVYALTTTFKKGKAVYKLKKLKTVTLKGKNGSYSGAIKNLLLPNDGKDYYISMKATKPKKGGAYYNVYLDSSSVFFPKGNTTDDSSAVSSMKSLSVASPGAKVLDDWVGYGDKIDYRKFTLSSAAKLNFILNAGNAAKLTLYKVVTKGSKTSLKAVGSVSVKKGKSGGVSLGLVKQGTYALSVKSTAPAKSDNTNYSVNLASNSKFYNHSDSKTSDDKVIVNGYVNSSVGNVGYLDNIGPYVTIGDKGWVGYGDTIDYRRFSLASKMNLTFAISATDKVQFTIYELVTKTSGKKTKYSLKKKKSWTPKNNGEGSYVNDKMNITLKAGTSYYFSVKSTNASKGGNAEYFVFITNKASISAAALAMPEASADLDSWNASSAAAPVQDDLLAGLADTGDTLAGSGISAAAALQQDEIVLKQTGGLLA